MSSVQKQLKRIKFGNSIWNRAEVRELPHILHEDEKVAECCNGFYEGGTALLVATDSRLLLIDKKPLNFLNVEDLRFELINEIDYSHRMMGAHITISTGLKTLKFSSYNQQRLRKLIGLVQERMSEAKKEQSEQADEQKKHLEEINKQLQMYLLAQHQQLQQQLSQSSNAPAAPRPDPQLADYLFAQRLMEDFQRQRQADKTASAPVADSETLRAAAEQEVFGRTAGSQPAPATPAPLSAPTDDTTALRIAYSKLPLALRRRKFSATKPLYGKRGTAMGPSQA